MVSWSKVRGDRVVRRCATKWRVAWSHTVLIETPLRRDCRSCLPTGLYLGQLCRKKYDSALRGQLPPLWKRGVGEMERGWKKTREGRRRGRIEQDQDPPRSNLALSHVRVIPFHPADQISPHLDSAYFAPCSARPIATKTTVRHSLLFHHFRPRSWPITEIYVIILCFLQFFQSFQSPFSFYLFKREINSIRANCFVLFVGKQGGNIMKGREHFGSQCFSVGWLAVEFRTTGETWNCLQPLPYLSPLLESRNCQLVTLYRNPFNIGLGRSG